MRGEFVVKPALCLDLDGTVRYSAIGEFINVPSDIRIFEGVEEIIWEYKNKGFLIMAASNQGGVAFGHKTPEQEQQEIGYMEMLFEHNPFDIICSSYSQRGGTVPMFAHRSLLRKPAYGMLVLAEYQAFHAMSIVIDWDHSIFVGDRDEDRWCADNAGVSFIYA